MMRNLLTLLLAFFVLGLQAQLTWTPEEPIGVGHNEMDEIQVDIMVTNTGSEDSEFYWQITVDDAPAEWQVVVCDNNLCYAPGILACPCASPNTLAAGATMTFMVKIKPKLIVGEGSLGLAITTDCEGTDALVSIPIDYEVELFSSVFDNQIENNIAIYPNPSIDFFSLRDDANISTVSIYSIVGKQIESFDHTPNQAYSVSDLRQGIYLVRAYDNQGKVLKSMRLSKK